MLDESLFEILEPEQKHWMILAIAGMVFADGKLDKDEREDLQLVLSLMEDIEGAQKLMKRLTGKQLPQLPKISVEDRGLAVLLLSTLTEVAIADNILSPNEAQYLIYIGAVLHFPKAYVEDFLTWAKQKAELNKFEESLVTQGNTLDLHDATLIGEWARKLELQDFTDAN